MRVLQALLLLIFLSAVLVFSLQNTEVLTVRFLGWSTPAPEAFLIVSVYLLGMLSGWTVVAFLSRSLRRVTERPRD
jgi:lipopolysaccharide assembly protein A